MTYKFTTTEQIKVQTDILGNIVSHKYFTLDVHGLLTINKGYSFDGMSFYYNDKTTYFASLYHDCLYQIIRLELINSKYKSNADKLLLKTLLDNNHPKLNSIIVYFAVIIFGKLFL